MLTPEQIKNLPSDTKKEYLRTMLLLDEKPEVAVVATGGFALVN